MGFDLVNLCVDREINILIYILDIERFERNN